MKVLNPENVSKIAQKAANQIARKYGHGKATGIVLGQDKEKVLSSTCYGYRKCSDGQYVPNAYRSKFGWKNTYYQSAECVVSVIFNH